MSTRNIYNSAGYGGLNGNYFFPESTNVMVLQRFWERGFVPFISNTNFMEGQDVCFNTPLRFTREPVIQVDRWDRNKIIKHHELDQELFEVFIGDQLVYSYKIDQCDLRSMKPAKRTEWASMIEKGAARKAHMLVSEEMVHYLITVAACENQGNNAGARTHRYPMGDFGNIFEVNANSVARVFSIANAVFREQGLYRENMVEAVGDSRMTLLVDSTFSEVLENSVFADRLLNGQCDIACRLLIDGILPERIHGYDIIETNCMPTAIDPVTDEEYTYIIALARNAVGFQGIHDELREADDAPHGRGHYLQGFMSYGYHIFYSEMVAIFKVKYADFSMT